MPRQVSETAGFAPVKTSAEGKVCRVVLALWIAGCGLSAVGRAQVEIRSQERERAFSGIEVTETPLVRHLFPDQQLAVWLPEGFAVQPRGAGGVATLSRDDDGAILHFGRENSNPGASLIQIMESTLEGLRRGGVLQEVESVRRMRLASRHAIEVTGTSAAGASAAEDRSTALRVVLAMDPSDEHYRVIVVRKAPEKGEPIDVLFRRLIRDWSPLDASVWNRSFERLRRSLVTAGSPAAWASRNRLFDAIAQPDAIGQSWVRDRLEALAEPDLLLDGLLHHHPRVRIACVEALDPRSVAEPGRSRLFAIAMQDPDPAVRYRVARRVVETPELASETLDRILDVDSDEARAGAFQLLTALSPALRAELVLATFGRLRQYPVKSQPFLAALLARWGPSEQAGEALYHAWKTSRQETLRKTALLELLEKGHREALDAALERLRQPLEAAPLELTRAAYALAVHAAADRERSLELLAASLEEAVGNAPSPELEEELDESRTLLRELLDYFESLPDGAVSVDECAVLGDRFETAWALERKAVQGCPSERPPDLVRISLPRPGGFASSLLGLLERLDLGSAPHNKVFHAGLDRLFETLRHWAGDPISMASTGLDLSAPLQLTWWPGDNGGNAAELSSDPGNSTLSARSGDFQRFLDSALRMSASSIDLPRLTTGLMAVHALPLMPVALFSQWDEERALLAGEDSESSTSTPPERYGALTAGSRSSGAELATLHELELDEEGGAAWNLTHFSRRGDRLTVTRDEARELGSAETESPSPASAGHESYIEVDLSGLLRHFEVEAAIVNGDDLVPPDLSLSARTDVEGPVIATRLELTGLPEDWLSAAANVPASELRAPVELLPRSCLTWVGLSFEPSALKRILESKSAALAEAIGEKRASKVLAAAEILQGEAGLALIDVPDPEQAADAWERHLVVYLSVEPEAADRFLKRTALGREKLRGLRLYRWEDGVAARFGRFLVAGSNAEILASLGEGPRFAASPVHQEILSRSQGDAALFAGFDTDLLADALRESLTGRSDEGPSTLLVEIFRSLGNVVAWVRREESSLVGELSISPRLQSEAQARVRQRGGYAGFVKGSISTDGLPPEAAIEPPYAEIELSLSLPEGAGDPALAWSHERHDLERLEPGEYHVVSRPGEPLPEESPVALPVTEAALLPYVRNEHNLNLHLEEVRELGERIRGSETDPARIVRAIVRWAHESLEYSVIDRATSVEEILATRQADCTEFTQLTIALARSLGIPARPVNGAHLGPGAAILHRWAEVFLDRWYEVDPTFGVVRVPATSVRIPADDAHFLASLPGSRFTVHSTHGAEGDWARRLGVGEPAARSGKVAVAVERDRVLVVYPTAGDDGAAGSRTLLSGDGGRSFAILSTAGLRGELVGLLGGHGRLLRMHRDDGDREASILVLYELSDRGEWQRLRLPEQIPAESGAVTLGVHSAGYLVFVEAPEPRLFRVEPGFEHAEEVPLPPPADGERLLAAGGGALAQTVPGAGVLVHVWKGGEWQPPLALEDSEELAAREIRRVGDRIEVVVEQRESGESGESGKSGKILFRLDGRSQSKSSVPSTPTGVASTTTGAGGETWILWADGTGRFLTRRSPELPESRPASHDGGS